MSREKILTITKKDIREDNFCTGGKGGQNQNKRKKGVRFTHLESGEVGEGREYKSKEQNRKAALRRMVEHKIFKLWIKKLS